MLLKESLSAPFSYLSFVIRSSFVKRNDSNKTKNRYIFDIEPYNYIFNQSTFFLDSQIYEEGNVGDEDLDYILTNMKRVDEKSVLLLTYELGGIK
jgi:hypothetical protein